MAGPPRPLSQTLPVPLVALVVLVAVVSGIVLIVIVDGVFAVLYFLLDI